MDKNKQSNTDKSQCTGDCFGFLVNASGKSRRSKAAPCSNQPECVGGCWWLLLFVRSLFAVCKSFIVMNYRTIVLLLKRLSLLQGRHKQQDTTQVSAWWYPIHKRRNWTSSSPVQQSQPNFKNAFHDSLHSFFPNTDGHVFDQTISLVGKRSRACAVVVADKYIVIGGGWVRSNKSVRKETTGLSDSSNFHFLFAVGVVWHYLHSYEPSSLNTTEVIDMSSDTPSLLPNVTVKLSRGRYHTTCAPVGTQRVMFAGGNWEAVCLFLATGFSLCLLLSHRIFYFCSALFHTYIYHMSHGRYGTTHM